jgi:hypothetical protein
MGLIPLLRLRLPQESAGAVSQSQPFTLQQFWKLHPFLVRFLPSMGLWTAVLASFTPFANVYLFKELHIPLNAIGAIFSSAQVIQLCVVLLTPVVFRWLGLVNGIVATQVATAAALACLAGTHDRTLSVGLYLSSSATQWMSSPGLYNLLMSKMPEAESSTSCATAAAGILFMRFGYPPVLTGIAVLALLAALSFKTLVAPADRPAPSQP